MAWRSLEDVKVSFSMNFTVLCTIAISSLSWSLFDMSRKKLASHIAPIPAVAWLMFLQAPLFAAFGVLEIWVLPSGGYWAPALASLLLNGLANILFIESVRLAPLSLAIPMLSLGPVFTSLGGWLVLGEHLAAQQAVGIVIIVAATFALGQSGARGVKGEDASTVRKGIGLMAGVAALWALTPVVDKIGLQGVPVTEHAALQCFGIAALLAIWVQVKGGGVGPKVVRANLKWFAIAVVFAALALGSQFVSIQGVPVGIFESLKRSSGLLLSLAFGFFAFREPITKSKLAFVALMGLGIAVLLIDF